MLVYRLMGSSAQERQVSQTFTGDIRIFLVTAGPTEHVQREDPGERRWEKQDTELKGEGARAFLEKFHQLKGSVGRVHKARKPCEQGSLLSVAGQAAGSESTEDRHNELWTPLPCFLAT